MITAMAGGFFKSEYFGLLLLLGMAFGLSFIPHYGYPYPIHVDEWLHLAQSEALIKEGSIAFTNPFTGTGVIYPDLEVGFHLLF